MAVIVSESRFEELRSERENSVKAALAEREADVRFSESKFASDMAIVASVDSLRTSVGDRASRALDVKVDEIALIDVPALTGTISEHLLDRLSKNGYPIERFDVPMKACFDHLRDFLVDLCLMNERAEIVVREPYVHHWKEKGCHDVA